MAPVGTDMNAYGRQLTPEQIAQGEHRAFVGGMWDEIGRLQFDFARRRGLLPSHRFFDVGCGALRGGVHFARYLQPGHYFGLDVNESLVEAGRVELAASGLADRRATLLVDDGFRLERFGVSFDGGIAVSVFTHLPMNSILRCLRGVAGVLAPGGVFHASYFRAPDDVHVAPIAHDPGGIVSQFDSDPFHYSFATLRWMGEACGLVAEDVGEWNHPRAQQMIAFRKGTP
jgi:SAM-dependent methyltransferase